MLLLIEFYFKPKLSIRNRNERLKYKEDKGSRNIFRQRNSDVYFEEKNRATPYTQSSLTL